MDVYDVDISEGSTCHKCHVGTMEIVRQYDCRCHISPPCSACVEAPLICNHCGYTLEYSFDDK